MVFLVAAAKAGLRTLTHPKSGGDRGWRGRVVRALKERGFPLDQPGAPSAWRSWL